MSWHIFALAGVLAFFLLAFKGEQQHHKAGAQAREKRPHKPWTWGAVGARVAVLAVLAFLAGNMNLPGLGRHAELGDLAGSLFGVLAVLLLLAHRRRAGRGLTVERSRAAMEGVLRQPVTVYGRPKFSGGQLQELIGQYPPHTDDQNPAMRQQMSQVLRSRIGAPVEVSWKPTEGLVRVRRKATQDRPEVVERVEQVVTLTLGADARVTITDRTEKGEPLAFEVKYPPASRPAFTEFRDQADRIVHELTGSHWSSYWQPELDRVTYRRREELPERVPHPADALPGSSALPFGVGAGGHVAAWELESDAPHCLVIGRTGSGKSVTMLGLAIEAARRGITVYVADPKRVDYLGLRGWPNVAEVATRKDTITELLCRIADEVESRYADLEAGTVDEDDLTPIMLVVDELERYVRQATIDWRASKQKGEAPGVAAWRTIALTGRKCRVHLLNGTQQPAAEWMGGTGTRDQFGCQVVMGNPSRFTRGMVEVEGEATRGVQGRAVADTGGGGREVQVYWTPDNARWARLTEADKAILRGLGRPEEEERDPAIEPQAKVVSIFDRGPVRQVEDPQKSVDTETRGHGNPQVDDVATGATDEESNPPGNPVTGRCPVHGRALSTCYVKHGCREPASVAWHRERYRREDPAGGPKGA